MATPVPFPHHLTTSVLERKQPLSLHKFANSMHKSVSLYIVVYISVIISIKATLRVLCPKNLHIRYNESRWAYYSLAAVFFFFLFFLSSRSISIIWWKISGLWSRPATLTSGGREGQFWQTFSSSCMIYSRQRRSIATLIEMTIRLIRFAIDENDILYYKVHWCAIDWGKRCKRSVKLR